MCTLLVLLDVLMWQQSTLLHFAKFGKFGGKFVLLPCVTPFVFAPQHCLGSWRYYQGTPHLALSLGQMHKVAPTSDR